MVFKIVALFIVVTSFLFADYYNNHDGSNYKGECVYDLQELNFNRIRYRLSKDNSRHTDRQSSLDDYLKGYKLDSENNCVKASFPTYDELDLTKNDYNFLMGLMGSLFGFMWLFIINLIVSKDY